MPTGFVPTLIVAMTALVDVFITETVFELEFVEYARVPSGFTATSEGPLPTVIVAATEFVAVLITLTVFDPPLGT
jgi:uncharacterized protein (UPF0212 family)